MQGRGGMLSITSQAYAPGDTLLGLGHMAVTLEVVVLLTRRATLPLVAASFSLGQRTRHTGAKDQALTRSAPGRWVSCPNLTDPFL